MRNLTNNPRRLRPLYLANIVAAGLPGAVMIAAPVWARANMFAGTQDPAMFGMTGAIWLAIGLASLLGLRQPELMKGIFLVQMIYKSIWIAAVGVPLLLQGELHVLPMMVFFMAVVVVFIVIVVVVILVLGRFALVVVIVVVLVAFLVAMVIVTVVVVATFAELDRRFANGFDPGDTLVADADSMRDPQGTFVVAFDDDRPVACGALIHLDDTTSEIKRMWVDADWRGMSLGGRMLAELERRAAEHASVRVVLDTNATLVEAIEMYERAGYSPIDRYNDNPYAQRWFEKRLRPE